MHWTQYFELFKDISILVLIKKSNKRKIIPKQIQSNKKCLLYKTYRVSKYWLLIQIWNYHYKRNMKETQKVNKVYI